jgi:parallel beta helix pectate lyase-like protein
MRRFLALSLTIAATIVSLTFFASTAHAQATRTWVSGVGDDGNVCSRTAPCKTFAAAISKTAIGGEINCLDPGGFGPLAITKSITIDCRGQLASIINGIATSGGFNAGIEVNFDSFDPSDHLKTVNIRNLTFNNLSAGGSGYGVVLAGAGQASVVNIENCVLADFNLGISDTRTRGLLTVKDTTVLNMSGVGINVPDSPSGSHRTVISNTTVINSATGIVAGTYDDMVISNSLISSNSFQGIVVDSNGTVSVRSSEIAHNGTGIQVSSGGSLLLSDSNLSFNSAAGFTGVIGTASNNSLYKNSGPLGTLVPMALQ